LCGITGWIDWKKNLTHASAIVERMTETLAPRGPDASGTWLSPHCAFGHRRLSVIDPENGAQPMIRQDERGTFVIVYNGEIYNAAELRRELRCRGHRFRTNCDTEVVLVAYMEWGAASAEKLNGIFAYAVWNSAEQRLFLARDRLGVKPLFYAFTDDGSFLFGSEPKAILAHPSFEAVVGAEGLAEIFAIGPARTPGHGIYRNMHELKPGHWMNYDRNGARKRSYWKLESRPHEDGLEKTADVVRGLLEDTVERQLVSDVPVCTLLSGGLDSSALTALAAAHYRSAGLGRLQTYSVDYVDNDKHFQSSAFQPNADGPWIETMSRFSGTEHHEVVFDTPELVGSLFEAVDARDMPGMADIDGSLFLFCREIRKGATVALSGEAADEVFGGYPWFFRRDALEARTFPWSLSLDQRMALMSPELAETTKAAEYVAERYHEALAEVPKLSGETPEQETMRKMSYLNITRFMPTLLDRKDRMSMRVGLEVRVPFCDHRLVEYVFNIPWEIKAHGGREKGIFRKAMRGILPDGIIARKKSPYPKTHNPNYTEAVRSMLLTRLEDSSSPLLPLISKAKVKELAESPGPYAQLPWFGQLMNMPQFFAWLLQVDYWMRTYRIRIA
jgi:asparagine synthase (glutamine-hydrolysing)